jgi:hypothetical protein
MQVADKRGVSQKFICTGQQDASGELTNLTCTPVATTENRTLVQSSNRSESTRYIRGGERQGGDGSRRHPWNSFSDAEGGDWTKLIILPSQIIIYGGITLYDGQTLEGEKRSRALLANPDDDSHNGDVIVVHGNVTIRNLTIVTAFRSAIEALHAKDLTIERIIIQESNLSAAVFSFDYDRNVTNVALQHRWAAISFFGGATTGGGLIQPFNLRSGTFTLRDSIIENSQIGVFVGSGDTSRQSAIDPQFFRQYHISNTDFSIIDHGIMVFASTGGVISGSIDNVDVTNGPNSNPARISTGVQIIGTSRNIRFPGRGEVTFETNRISRSSFRNISGRGIIVNVTSSLLENQAKFIIKDNEFENVGLITTVTVPATIRATTGAITILSERDSSALGYLETSISGNTITDNSGLASGIGILMLGSPLTVVGKIQNNDINGTTTGIIIIVANLTPNVPEAVGRFYIAENLIENVDAALVVAGSVEGINDVEVVVEHNCFENTGNRQLQLGRPGLFAGGIITGANASYYGGTVIYGGGIGNPALRGVTVTRPTTGIILDLGNGELNSDGHNNFINTTGAHVWIEAGLGLVAEHNWFNGRAPVSAGGGVVDFQPQLRSGRSTCHGNDDSSSSD